MKGFLLVILFATASFASVTNIQVTPTGSATGNCTGSGVTILTPAQFNTSGNWGSGSTQIGAGTTVLLCGAFTSSTAGATFFYILGSGSNGNPITILFDTNASISNSAYWGYGSNDGGAIYSSGKSYITINGGTNGLIQNTGNGTGLAYAMPSSGVSFANGSNIIVENLTVANICQHTSVSDTNGCNFGGNSDAAIYLNGPTNLTVQNNTVYYTNCGICYQPPSGTDSATFASNTLYWDNWGIGVSYSASSGTASGITISNNNIYDAYPWDTGATDTFHHNGIIVFDTSGTGAISNVTESGNYIHGTMTNAPGGSNNDTSWIFQDDNTGQMTNFLIYNNVLVNGGTVGPGNCYITGAPTGSQVYNNTIWGNGAGGTAICASSGTTIENNVMANVKQFLSVTSPTLVDYNQYMTVVSSGCSPYLYGGGPCSGQNTFAAWQTACSCDAHGAYNATDTINSNGTPQAGSPVIGAGVNLTSLSIAGLDSATTAGNTIIATPRPASGAWDAGAYFYVQNANATGSVFF